MDSLRNDYLNKIDKYLRRHRRCWRYRSLFGILFILAGKGLWKITLKYIQVVSRQKNSVIT